MLTSRNSETPTSPVTATTTVVVILWAYIKFVTTASKLEVFVELIELPCLVAFAVIVVFVVLILIGVEFVRLGPSQLSFRYAPTPRCSASTRSEFQSHTSRPTEAAGSSSVSVV